MDAVKAIGLATTLSLALSCSPSGGPESPEAVLRKAQEATSARDWGGYFDAWDSDSFHVAILAAYLAAFASGDGSDTTAAELSALMKKYGAEEDQKESDLGEGFRKAVLPVKDRRGLHGELMSYAEVRMKKKGKPLHGMEGTLQDLKVDGDQATASLLRPNGKKSRLSFIRRGKGWFIKTVQSSPGP